jgi:hypothetical protein
MVKNLYMQMKDINERHSLIFAANSDQISNKKGGLIP